jgi:hypothetical protein
MPNRLITWPTKILATVAAVSGYSSNTVANNTNKIGPVLAELIEHRTELHDQNSSCVTLHDAIGFKKYSHKEVVTALQNVANISDLTQQRWQEAMVEYDLLGRCNKHNSSGPNINAFFKEVPTYTDFLAHQLRCGFAHLSCEISGSKKLGGHINPNPYNYLRACMQRGDMAETCTLQFHNSTELPEEIGSSVFFPRKAITAPHFLEEYVPSLLSFLRANFQAKKTAHPRECRASASLAHIAEIGFFCNNIRP